MTLLYGLIILGLGITCGFSAAKFMQYEFIGYITADDARDISDDYTEEIKRLEDLIIAAAGRHEHFIKETGKVSPYIVNHFSNEEIGFVVNDFDDHYTIEWEDENVEEDY